MRNLLIILSIILLSSPVIGDNHNVGTLYPIYDETGLFGDKFNVIWIPFGNDKHPKYVGEIRNGKPNGWGVLTQKRSETYWMGIWENGRQRKVKRYNELNIDFRDLDIDKNGKGSIHEYRMGNDKWVGEFKFISPIELTPFRFQKGIFFENGKPKYKVKNESRIEQYINGEWKPYKRK